MQNQRSLSLAALACIYLVARFGFTAQLDSLGNYSSYIFEFLCVAVAIALVGKETFHYFRLKKTAAMGSLLALIAGFSAFKFAGAMGLIVPFDFKGTESVLFLLVVAPLLEEFLFRFFLWKPIEDLTHRPMTAWIITSLLFSCSHLHAIWFAPPELHGFIWFQTAYTLLLGLACGFYIRRHSSLISAMIIHFGFNFGFYLAAMI